MKKNYLLTIMITLLLFPVICAKGNNEVSNYEPKLAKESTTPFTIPFKCPFATLAEFNLWTVIDSNKDGFTWKEDIGLKNAKYSYSTKNFANDWLISPAIALETGKEYRLSFETRSNSNSYPESIKVYMGQGVTVDSQTELLGDFPNLSGTFTTKYITIAPAMSGDYNIGFYACSKANLSYLHLRNISIEDMRIPDQVMQLNLIPEASGAKSATISFLTPTLTIGGKTLTSISKIEIFREEALIKTFAFPAVGSLISYVDNVDSSGTYKYTIVASNSDGEGVPSSASSFIGEDVVVAPQNIVLTSIGTNGVLNWEAPTAGVNNGWINSSSLTYKITRLPDNVVVTESAVGLTYTDSSIPKFANYSYNIQAKTSAGAGGTGISNTLNIGNSLQVPYLCNFGAKTDFDVWTIIDANNDGSTWKYDAAGKFAACQYNAHNNSDDWFISPPIMFEAGKSYSVKFDVKAGSNNYYESIKVYYGNGATIETQQEHLLADYQQLNSSLFESRILVIKPETSGVYNIGFYACSPKNQHLVSVTNIVVDKLVDNNLSSLSIVGSTLPMINKEYVYTVKVKNSGVLTQSEYIVQLVDGNGNVLSEQNVNKSIKTEESVSVKLKYIPTSVGDMSVKGKVILTGDQKPDDNQTRELLIDVQPISDSESIYVKFDNTVENKILPINFYYKAHASQTIYFAEELIVDGGLIKKIIYPYNNKNTLSYTKPIKVYMGTTELTNLTGGWFPEDKLTLVFDGNVTLEPGIGELSIELSTPFIYSGGNLCIMNIRPLDTQYINNVNYYLGTKRELCSRTYQSDTKGFTFEETSGTNTNNIPNVKIVFDAASGAKLVGKITNGGVPIEGAVVKSHPHNLSTITNADGEYQFDWLPATTYSLNVSKYGYENYEQSDVIVVANQTNTVNIEISILPSYTLSGLVKDADNNAIEGASIVLKGYKAYDATTNAYGLYTIPDVYKTNDYNLKVVKHGYSSYATTVNMVNSDMTLPTITLNDIPNPPRNIEADATIYEADISWEKPSEMKLFRYDDGVHAGQLGFTNGTTGNGVMGSVHRVPAVLSSMSWYTVGDVAYGGPHNTVNVWVFDLDENGEPTSNVLFNQSNVPNIDDQWTSFTFPESVECPRGFMIGIGYAGFVGIGMDTGTSTEWPFVTNGNYRIGNYTSGIFIPNTAEENIQFNFMIRAEGHESNKSAVAKSVNGYKIWRLSGIDENDESKWTLITESTITETEYKDLSWESVGSGVYQYAVKTVFSNGVTSAPAFSNLLSKEMNTSVTINVTTNTEINDSEGAIVELINNDNKPEHVFTSIVNVDGSAIFTNMWKGTYKINVTKTGYEAITDLNVDFSTDSEYSKDYILQEIVELPFNLKIVENEYPTEKILNWNIDDSVKDDFEGHQDFIINSPGDLGWSYIDADDSETASFTGILFPNAGEKMAYIVFNPSKTNPVLDPLSATSIQPHSGNKLLASFASSKSTNKDFLISPKLSYNKEFTFSFWAKTQNGKYGLERIKVGYSRIGKAESDFREWLTTGDYIEVPEAWTQYSYTVPADAKYVTIECVSNDAFVLMIDDVFIGTRPESSKSLQNYEVYLDGNKKADVTQPTYTFTDLSIGTHKAGVKAIYGSTTTETVTIDFNVTGIPVAAAVSGVANDVNGLPIANVDVRISGSRSYETVTAADGSFNFPAVMAATGYKATFSKADLGNQVRTFSVIAGQDITLGTVILGENTFTPKRIMATVNESNVNLTWVDGSTPTEDTFRYDDGTAVNGLGANNGTDKTIVGNVFNVPASLTSVTWLTVGSATKVNVFVFDITDDGKPTNTILYTKTDVNNVVNDWNTFTFPSQVECPRGFYIAISISAPTIGNVAVGMDSGSNPEWPFIPSVGYFSPDYTGGNFQYTGNTFTKNIMIRAEGFVHSQDAEIPAPIAINEDVNSISNVYIALSTIEIESEPIHCEAKLAESKSFMGYNVWRLKPTDQTEETKWELLTNQPVAGSKFTDTAWETVTPDSYQYAVKAIYTGGVISEVGFSNIISRSIKSAVNVNVTIKGTTLNLSDASVKLTNNDGIQEHIYNAKTNSNGKATFPSIYKGIYELDITADGYTSFTKTDVDLSVSDKYTIDCSVEEVIITPSNLEIVKTDADNQRIFNWNLADNSINNDFESKSLVNYEIYLNAVKVSETKNTTYIFNDLTEGNHIAGVKAIYISASSGLVTIPFEVILVGVDQLNNTLSLNIYPNPFHNILNVEGEYQLLEIYNASGKLVITSHGESQIDVSKLVSGIYILKAYNDDHVGIYKIVK